jgi:hypothetical protein
MALSLVQQRSKQPHLQYHTVHTSLSRLQLLYQIGSSNSFCIQLFNRYVELESIKLEEKQVGGIDMAGEYRIHVQQQLVGIGIVIVIDWEYFILPSCGSQPRQARWRLWASGSFCRFKDNAGAFTTFTSTGQAAASTVVSHQFAASRIPGCAI